MADRVSRHSCSRFSAGRLHRTSGIHGEETELFYQRLSTPRPAAKIVLKRCLEIKSSSNTAAARHTIKHKEPLLRRRSIHFNVDLRIQGIPQNAVLEDQGRMTKIKNWWTSCELNTKPNRSLPILGKKENIQQVLRRTETYRLKIGEIWNCVIWEKFRKTIQCQPCLKNSPEGLVYCSGGECPHALAGTETQDQNSILDHVCSVLRRELLTRSETWAEPVSV